MRIFAQKPKATQLTTPPKPVMLSRAHFGQDRGPNSILNLQRTIRNQAEQRLLKINKGDVEGESVILKNTYFGNDISQIPIHTPAPGAIQAKLVLNKAGDEYEQEADHISEQLTRMPEPQLQRAGACSGACPGYKTEQLEQGHDHLQIQPVRSGDWGQTEVPPIVHEVLRSPGRPIDLATRAFMELRFGHDFSRVRIHHDVKAAKSARLINALAYTSGNHIAFNDGQYNPTTERGKRLLAHELVHTMQQGNNILHRKIDFTPPKKPELYDPISLVLGGKSILGSTLPGFNGKLFPPHGIKKDYEADVFKVLQPLTYKFSKTKDGETCKVDADSFKINVFAEVKAITEPKGNKWSGSYSPITLSNPPSVCAKAKKDIQAEMEGKPDSIALYKKVLRHEGEHVADLENLTNKVLKPYHDFLVGLTGTGKTEKGCVDDIFNQVGKKDATTAIEFVDKWLASVQVYDKKGGTHHSTFKTEVDPECTKMHITEKL